MVYKNSVFDDNYYNNWNYLH